MECRKSPLRVKSLEVAIGPWRLGPSTDVPELKGSEGFDKALGDLSQFVVTHHMTTVDALTVESCQCLARAAEGYALLLIRQHFDKGKSCGVTYHNVQPACHNRHKKSGPASSACGAMNNLAEVGQRLR